MTADAAPERAKPPNMALAAGVIAFLRGEFRNDGAEGESVHKLCDFFEQLARAHAADLGDHAVVLRNVSEVYYNITGARVSNVLTLPEALCAAVDQRVESESAFAVECALEPVREWADQCTHSLHPVEKERGANLLDLLDEIDDDAPSPAADHECRAIDVRDVPGATARVRMSPDASPESVAAIEAISTAAAKLLADGEHGPFIIRPTRLDWEHVPVTTVERRAGKTTCGDQWSGNDHCEVLQRLDENSYVWRAWGYGGVLPTLRDAQEACELVDALELAIRRVVARCKRAMESR
jgi:hypothetical protein